jgi:hypothetical protein
MVDLMRRKSQLAAAALFYALLGSFAMSNAASGRILCERASCLLARDIDGIQLDMTVQEVAALMPNGLEPLGRGQFRAKGAGVEYDFGFSALGHLFRIDSSRTLGRFIPDRSFGDTLKGKLTSKFGKPQADGLPVGPAFWEFAEFYTDARGLQFSRDTESLSAVLGGGFDEPIKLNMKLMDFRILRRDLTILNAAPETEASGRIQF